MLQQGPVCGLVQYCSISIANALEILQSCQYISGQLWYVYSDIRQWENVTVKEEVLRLQQSYSC